MEHDGDRDAFADRFLPCIPVRVVTGLKALSKAGEGTVASAAAE